MPSFFSLKKNNLKKFKWQKKVSKLIDFRENKQIRVIIIMIICVILILGKNNNN